MGFCRTEEQKKQTLESNLQNAESSLKAFAELVE